MGKHKIILDTDPALGVRLGVDIDDDLAIMFLLASPEVEIIGLTTTYGNSSRDKTFYDAKRLLALAGRSDIPVLKGAGWLSRDIKKETEASRFIADAIKNRPGEITMVTIGPLTNLAAAMHTNKDLAHQIKELLMMGGRSKSGLKEFNFGAHPGATAKVLSSSASKFVVTLDLCFQVVFKPEHLKSLKGPDDLLISPFFPAVRRWLKLNRFGTRLLAGLGLNLPQGGFFPWDGIAVSYLIKPELFSEVEPVRLGMARDKMIVEKNTDQANAQLPAMVDAEKFMELFLSRVRSLKLATR